MIRPSSTQWFTHRFSAHLASVDQSYLQHCLFAARIACRLFAAAGAAMAHALVPTLFETTASRIICDLHEQLVKRHQAANESTDLAINE